MQSSITLSDIIRVSADKIKEIKISTIIVTELSYSNS